jgi:hypothetical protein
MAVVAVVSMLCHEHCKISCRHRGAWMRHLVSVPRACEEGGGGFRGDGWTTVRTVVLSSLFIALHGVLIKSSLPHVNESTIKLAWWTNLGSALALAQCIIFSGNVVPARSRRCWHNGRKLWRWCTAMSCIMMTSSLFNVAVRCALSRNSCRQATLRPLATSELHSQQLFKCLVIVSVDRCIMKA